MKTLVKSLLVAATLTLTTFAVSQAEPGKPVAKPKNTAAFQSSMYTNLAGKLQIAVKKETAGTVVVRLVDKAGKEVFVQQVAKRRPAARLSLDVSALPDGVYQVEISNGVETTTQALTLATQQPVAAPRFVAIN
ncbi:T9SS type A sorting domain-containing protein [Larkinella sp. C7]|jgi:hypothetical protein|uniref:T9SS type A sorting domain-containing protein n=1 Tax=Larkinella sp. C7 TaxID=2576607 RepID=UPI001111399D|nr:T9SS type A sorting domain-containing protein [Larkinella sp. C7]